VVQETNVDYRSLAAIFVECARAQGLTSEVVIENGELTIRVADEQRASIRPLATLTASLPESFFLTLDNGYSFQDFDWEDDGQKAILQSFCDVIDSHRHGHGVLRIEKGLLRRPRYIYEIAAGDTVWTGRRPER
jgi:hypothetical protein